MELYEWKPLVNISQRITHHTCTISSLTYHFSINLCMSCLSSPLLSLLVWWNCSSLGIFERSHRDRYCTAGQRGGHTGERQGKSTLVPAAVVRSTCAFVYRCYCIWRHCYRKFHIVCGCWGVKPIKFEFNDDMLNNKDILRKMDWYV